VQQVEAKQQEAKAHKPEMDMEEAAHNMQEA
jgi:hypothetical protein